MYMKFVFKAIFSKGILTSLASIVKNQEWTCSWWQEPAVNIFREPVGYGCKQGGGKSCLILLEKIFPP